MAYFKHIIFFLCLLLSGTGNVLTVSSQVAYAPQPFQDDPIASALDSLNNLNMFEKGFAKISYPESPKYLMPHDSIPRYDESVYRERLAKLDAASPFDLTYNTAVKDYIEMYAYRKRILVSRMMALSQLYFPLFEQTLDKYNLPLELKYLAICESALNPLAKSRAGAMGLWQFMYGTGKMYNLRVTSYIDERCDPYKSTVAACEYFKYLYSLFGDWQMVLAAYNGGPGTVNKAIRRSGGKKTYWEIRPYLPRETQGYVPAFIAVNYVMNYTSEHNLYSAIPKRTFIELDTVEIKKQLSFDQISAVLNLPAEDVQILNPSYRKRIIPADTNEHFTLTLPYDKVGLFITNEDSIYSYLRNNTLNSNVVIETREIKKTHTVKKGETLSAISRKYHCSVSDIKTWNHLRSGNVSPGKKLVIYTQEVIPVAKPASTSVNTDTKTTDNNKENAPIEEKKNSPGSGYKYYTIQNGDSLFKIAQKHKTTVDELKRLNSFGAKYVLLPGKKIKVGIL